MILITKKMVLSTVVERYKKQYPTNFVFPDGSTSDENIAKLVSGKLTEKRVKSVLHESWIRVKCHECGRDVKHVVCFFNANEEGLCLCERCLNNALQLMFKNT